jgi:hypothetical protein
MAFFKVTDVKTSDLTMRMVAGKFLSFLPFEQWHLDKVKWNLKHMRT